MARRLKITPSSKPVMTVDRRAIRKEKLVYIICTPRVHRYERGKSRIIYIGTTGQGVRRVASSMSHKAIDFLEKWGVKRLDVHLVTCPPRPGARSWLCLERDLLITFKLLHGRVPLANKTGKNYVPDRLSGLFQYRRMVKIMGMFCTDRS